MGLEKKENWFVSKMIKWLTPIKGLTCLENLKNDLQEPWKAPNT